VQKKNRTIIGEVRYTLEHVVNIVIYDVKINDDKKEVL